MSGSLRLGLIGAGGIAQTYAEIGAKLANARVTAVVDVVPEAAERLAAGVGATAYTSYEKLQGVDAVMVCTPPATHPEIATYFLERGVPVLCEKPLAIDLDGAKAIVDAAAASETLVTMASKFRYVEDISQTRALLESGILGEIILYENTFASRVDMRSRWNSQPAISGGGVLIDNGTHSIDIARYLLGPIAHVLAVEGKRVQSDTVEDTARIFIRSAEDVMGSIDLSWSIHKELDSFVEIYGTEGTVRVGWKKSAYKQQGADDWVVFGTGYNKHEAIGAQVQNFVNAIRDGAPLVITAEDALASVRVMEAAYASLRRNDWIPVGSEPVVDPARVLA